MNITLLEIGLRKCNQVKMRSCQIGVGLLIREGRLETDDIQREEGYEAVGTETGVMKLQAEESKG